MAVTLDDVTASLAEQGISLSISHKKVKNINFRVKPNQLLVSAPTRISQFELAHAIAGRVDWAISANKKLLNKQDQQPSIENRQFTNGDELKLWGEAFTLHLHTQQAGKSFCSVNHFTAHIHLYITSAPHTASYQTEIKQQLLALYRSELAEKMPALFEKWQPVVGKCAKETRIKKMTTRWGSCNVQKKRVWLSVYLAQYPLDCTEYVIVHELCHLHEANHSKRFWWHVQNAMPNYQYWHNYLKGTGKAVD